MEGENSRSKCIYEWRDKTMKALTCEMCGSNRMVKQDGMYVCQSCKTQYTVEEARKLMVEVEGTVDVQGTVKVDNSAFVEKYLKNARRAYEKEDWEEVEKYYNLVEQNTSANIEAVFFSAFGKAMLSLSDQDYYKREQKFNVLNKSISVINDYFEVTNEDKQAVLKKIASAIEKMFSVTFVYNPNNGFDVGGLSWMRSILDKTKNAYITELKQIFEKHRKKYIQELITSMSVLSTYPKGASGGCYVATCVYGSYDCPEVWTLRRYRDGTLGSTWYGRAFIRTYYAISPTLVKWFGHTNWFKRMWKGKLDKMVKNLQEKGVENTPYEDKDWQK